jgi:phytoene desaturase
MTHRVAIVGAGMGGLAAAIDLARQGAAVTVFDKLPTVGGKMRRVAVTGTEVDGGPTVFTLRWVFEQLLADAGASLEERLDLAPLDVLARHAWRQGGRLDLYADVERSAQAITDFAGTREADGYRRFCEDSRRIYRTLAETFMAADKPSPLGLVRRVGLTRIGALWATSPWRRLWPALGDYFSDPRLRQLFARYATYCGASPWLAPATLMLVAHVEQEGVWAVQGGMAALAASLAGLVQARGGHIRCGARVAGIEHRGATSPGVWSTLSALGDQQRERHRVEVDVQRREIGANLEHISAALHRLHRERHRVHSRRQRDDAAVGRAAAADAAGAGSGRERGGRADLAAARRLVPARADARAETGTASSCAPAASEGTTHAC